MYIAITRQQLGDNFRGSARDFVNYLGKENEGKEPEQQEGYFNQEENNIDADSLWAYNYFADGMLRSYSALFGYLVENEGGYPGARAWFADHSDIIKTHCPPEGAAEIV